MKIANRTKSSIVKIYTYGWACMTGILVSPAMTAAQSSLVEIPSPVACSDCSIKWERVATIGDPGDPVSLGPGTFLAVTSDRIIAVSPYDRNELLYYDRNGKFVNRVGRLGEGPGEFQGIEGLRAYADSVSVASYLRISVYDSGGRLVRLNRLPAGLIQDHVPLPDGGAVTHEIVYTRNRVGLPLHRFTSDGSLAFSFGDDGRHFLEGEQIQKRRRIAWNGGVRIWSFEITRYMFSELDTEKGDTVHSFIRTADWFPSWTAEEDRTRRRDGGTPYSRVFYVMEDNSGLLWVAIGVADPQKYAEDVEPKEWLKLILEVIDPSEGRVITREELSWGLFGFPAPGMAAVARRREDTGEYWYDIYRVTINKTN